MGKATLVVMAAGIGSRFGKGIKQLEPVGPGGEIIMDYSIFDAIEAGFDKVVFVIRKDLEEDFKNVIGNRIGKVIKTEYAFQEKGDIPEPYRKMYVERKKPWGTGHAILCCKDLIKEPFLVVNADDYYGKTAYKTAYEYLIDYNKSSDIESIGMVGFVLGNTLSENGSVTRGICEVNQNQKLSRIEETYRIEKSRDRVVAIKDNREFDLNAESIVSMNMWMFQPSFFSVLENGFQEFLESCREDYQEAEYLLPSIIGKLIEKKEAEVTVLNSDDQWYGITYLKDKKSVEDAICKMIEENKYPTALFSKTNVV